MSKKPNYFGSRKKHKKPKYADDVANLATKLGPGVHTVNICHDDDCPMLNGGTECTCNPIVKLASLDS